MVKTRILLIDDEADFAELLQRHLEGLGPYDVRTESRGSQVVAVAREFQPHLILLDILLPDVPGSAVAVELASDDRLKRIPVIFLTAGLVRRDVDSLHGMFCGHPLLSKLQPIQELVACVEQRMARVGLGSEPSTTTT